MKPMHAEVTRLSRCPCCHSKYTARGMFKKNTGKSAARIKQKAALRKEIKDLS